MSDGLLYKIKLYILSLSLLFLIVTVMSLKFPPFYFHDSLWSSVFKYSLVFLSANKLPAVMMAFFVWSMLIKKEFGHFLQGGGEQTIRILKIKSDDYEHLTFFATYIIPFFGFSFDSVQKILSYFILLFIIGYMLIKTDRYYANPTLAIMGFKLYKANLHDEHGVYEDVTLISKDNLMQNEPVRYKCISKNVFYVKRLGE